VTQTFSNCGKKISEFSQAFLSLKQSLDTGNIVQAVFVCTRALEGVEAISMFSYFICADQMFIDRNCYAVVKMEILRLLDPVKMDASSRPQCLLGTRRNVLSFVTSWLATPSEGQNVLWLHGVAGSGKSTISTTVAECFRDLGRLGAFIFFDRNNPIHSDPNNVIRTLAHRLASFDSHIRSAVCAAIDNDGSIAEAPIERQFAKLLLEPLISATMPGPVVIVIDAFDECGDSTSRKRLLSLLVDGLSKFPGTFRFFITSREVPDIKTALGSQPNVLNHELAITTDSNMKDISLFLQDEMATIRKHHSTFDFGPDWPGEPAVRDLVKRSGGLFIWASLAASFIREGHSPIERLKLLLPAGCHGKADVALDSLYATTLHAVGKWDSEAFSSDFRAIMGAVLVGRIPLPDTLIDQLLGLGGHNLSQFILQRLRSLLIWHPGQPVRILHASLSEYLTDRDRSGKEPWFIDLTNASTTVALSCLRIMTTGTSRLRFNICNLETSYLPNSQVPGLSRHIETNIKFHLIYACQHWAEHLRTGSFNGELMGSLEDFVHNYLLHWLEVLSLISCVHVASPALLKAAEWIHVSWIVCWCSSWG
jgi:hypothetical protein